MTSSPSERLSQFYCHMNINYQAVITILLIACKLWQHLRYLNHSYTTSFPVRAK